MKLANFRDYKAVPVEKIGDVVTRQIEYATVDVRHWGRWSERKIFSDGGGPWRFEETGAFTPGYQAEFLVKAYMASQWRDK